MARVLGISARGGNAMIRASAIDTMFEGVVNFRSKVEANTTNTQNLTNLDINRYLTMVQSDPGQLVFDSSKEFLKSAIELKKSATDSPLTLFAVCTTYRKTVKMQSKMQVLHIINWKGEFKEKKVHSSSQVHGEYFLHLRLKQSFQFKDFLKTKMVPAHWLKIEPIPMGEKKVKL